MAVTFKWVDFRHKSSKHTCTHPTTQAPTPTPECTAGSEESLFVWEWPAGGGNCQDQGYPTPCWACSVEGCLLLQGWLPGSPRPLLWSGS